MRFFLLQDAFCFVQNEISPEITFREHMKMSECVAKIKDSEAMYLRVKQYLNISFKSSPALFRRGSQMTTTALKENGPIGTLARSEALPTFCLQQCWNKKWNSHDFLNPIPVGGIFTLGRCETL